MTERDAIWALFWAQQLTGRDMAPEQAGVASSGARTCLARIRSSHDRRSQALRAALRQQPPPAVPDDVVLYCDDDYPGNLRHLPDPPLGLFVAGDRSLLRHPAAIAVVGSRHPRGDSEQAARTIAGTLARSGLAVVSGLAIGIDGIAHTAALDVSGPTIAVLGSGLGKIHPARHRSLARRIVTGGSGVIVSEHAAHVGAHARFFPARNRIIAALSRFVVVVQAGNESGSLQTARRAVELGIDVGVVPGAVSDVAYTGSLQLLRDGARVVVDASCVFRAVGLEEPTSAAQHQFGTLLDAPRHPDDVAAHVQEPIDDVLAQLLELELQGLVRRGSDGRYSNVVAGQPAPA